MSLETSYSDLFFDSFDERVGRVDLDNLKAETLVYGAKTANLNALSLVLNQITHRIVEIPDYIGIPVSIYIKWRDGLDVREDLMPFYNWICERRVIVRSSAVFSEDGEDLTGAGVYESKTLTGVASFEDFCEAVFEVYRSVDSEFAVKYREEHGIEEELMGITLQQLESGVRGTVNTVLCQVPDLLEFDVGAVALMNRDELINASVSGERINRNNHDKLYHITPDSGRMPLYSVNHAAIVCMLIERWYDRPVQIELVLHRDHYLKIVQVRPLPKIYSERNTVTFPDEPHVYRGRAVGVGDEVLRVLDWRRDSTPESHGVTIYQSTEHFGSMGVRRPNLPKSGGAIVLQPNERRDRGHVETLCAEKRLLAICPRDLDDCDWEGAEALLKEIDNGRKKFRLVLNGIEGRVY